MQGKPAPSGSLYYLPLVASHLVGKNPTHVTAAANGDDEAEQGKGRESEHGGIEGLAARSIRELVFWLHEVFMALPWSSS